MLPIRIILHIVVIIILAASIVICDNEHPCLEAGLEDATGLSCVLGTFTVENAQYGLEFGPHPTSRSILDSKRQFSTFDPRP